MGRGCQRWARGAGKDRGARDGQEMPPKARGARQSRECWQNQGVPGKGRGARAERWIPGKDRAC